MSEILEIAWDEAGHTGPDLLQKDQRMFAFCSVAVSGADALEIIRKARTDHPVQMPELKASKLLDSERGRRLIASVLQAIDSRYVVSVNDKLLALCGWFFEYIYEPVYQRNPRPLYEKNSHRFVAMYTYLWMTDPKGNAKLAIEQFQKYMRSRNPAVAAQQILEGAEIDHRLLVVGSASGRRLRGTLVPSSAAMEAMSGLPLTCERTRKFRIQQMLVTTCGVAAASRR